MTNDLIIRTETEKDYKTAENVTREAFWNVYRPGCLEHYVLNQFRSNKDFIPQLSFVLEKDGKVIGHIMYAKAYIELEDDTKLPIMTFGPFSILPQYRGKGYGAYLLTYSMERAVKMGAKALAITGDINYYGRFGFVLAKTKNVFYKADPDADYFLIKELEQGFITGIKGYYTDPDGYFVDETEAEIFEAQFAPIQKLILPTQLV